MLRPVNALTLAGLAARQLQVRIASRAAPSIEDIAAEVGVTAKNMKHHLSAAAELSPQFQDAFLLELLKIVQQLGRGQAWKPVALIEHCVYDETPLLASTHFDGPRAVQKAKVFLFRSRIGVLSCRLRDIADLHGPGGDDSASGEASGTIRKKED